MLGFDLQTKTIAIILILILLGLGVGAFQPSNSSTFMGAVERGKLGSVSALISTERQVGISLGMAMSGAIFSAGENLRRSIAPAYREVLFLSPFLAIGAMVFALLSAIQKTQKRPKRVFK